MNTEEHNQLFKFSRSVDWRLGIGDVSTATGVSQSQLRYWEQKGYIQSKKENGQNRKYSYPTLIKVFMISSSMKEGFTLTAAVKRADEHKEIIDLLKRAMIDRFQSVDQVDGNPAINMGYVDDKKTEILYFVIEKDHTEIKLVPAS